MLVAAALAVAPAAAAGVTGNAPATRGARPAERRCGSLCQVPERAGRPFLILTVAFFTLLLGSNLPTPLYAVYRERFGFSSAVLTLVFATYMVVLVADAAALRPAVGPRRAQARGRRRDC